jgi:putative ABC transport system permease protein
MMGRIVDMLRLAGRQLLTRRARILLTVLGIAIGVAAVTGIVSLTDGIRYQAIETIRAQSDLNLFEIIPGTHEGTTQLLTEARVRDIRTLPGVTTAAGIFRGSCTSERQTYLGVVAGDPGELLPVLRPRLMRGDFNLSGTSDAVLGYALFQRLQRYEGIRFGDTFTVLVRDYDEAGMPRDRKVNITAAGVLQERDDAFDEVLIVDRDTARELWGERGNPDGVLVRAEDPSMIFPVVDRVRALSLDARGAFEQITAVNRFMDLILLVSAGFAGIALVVGGLMITTTMVTSVFERTREIGITMAVGASTRDVIQLVLTECLLIGILGGIAGDLLGGAFVTAMNIYGRPFLVSRLGPEFSGLFGTQVARMSPELAIAGFLIAVTLSLLAGLYPAWRAARLNPVDAIRRTV